MAIDIIECMFEYGEMVQSAAFVDYDDTADDTAWDDTAVDVWDTVCDPPQTKKPQAGRPIAIKPEADRPQTVLELQARIRQMQSTKLDTRSLPTHPALAALLPGGGLKQGAAYSVDRSTTLLMALLAGPSAAGSWCGVVGVPEFGIEAAAGYGIDLDRLVLVPNPGDQWLAVTAAIADVLTVVVTRPPRQTSDSTVARLAARLRQRGSTLIVLGPWPQTDAMLSIEQSRWSGIGAGHGHLAAREATVTVSTRAGGRPRSARLWLPDTDARMRGAAPRLGDARQSAGLESRELAG